MPRVLAARRDNKADYNEESSEVNMNYNSQSLVSMRFLIRNDNAFCIKNNENFAMESLDALFCFVKHIFLLLLVFVHHRAFVCVVISEHFQLINKCYLAVSFII